MQCLAMIMLLSATARGQETGPIVSEAVIEAPLDSVWHAWTTGEGLMSWLAPQADIELRVGGVMRANYRPGATLGDGHTIENLVLSFEPRRMLSIKVSVTPVEFPFANAIQHMWTVLYFDSVADRRTKVRVVSLGFRPDAESQRMRKFFEGGNATTLQQLQRRFAASKG